LLKWIYRLFIELSNHLILSSAIKAFTQSKISKILIPSYVKIYKINQTEMEEDLKNFHSLQELFIRRLKEGIRPIDTNADSVVSPVDAILEEIGTITPSKEIIVKNKRYSLQEMIGDNDILSKYIGGTFIILYLSPSHYHRIHSPISGVITKQWSLGKKSYPVNKWGMKFGKDPLTKNYRTITEVFSEGIHVAIVKVGAMFINSIELTHTSEYVEKGQEMAYFSFGSTVVLLFEKGCFEADENLHVKKEMKVGQKLGFIKKRA
jgi:phosphatidylserine decarboxylase